MKNYIKIEISDEIMILFKEALKILEESNEFKKWKKKNPSTYLSHGFLIIESTDYNWKIGYYDKKKDKLTSFDVGKKITIEPEEDVFKKEKSKDVKKLDLDKVKLDLSEAVAISKQLQEEEYSTENPTKIIAILQKIDAGQVWNITYLTQNFNTLNFKIKTETGRVLEKKLTGLMEFKK
ncbi:hypothetical protein KY342_00800 [Candidatus Woesearchaeota archaeon]|nr:hypothetical protein [Candidatus Woesearchaeota archaeon]